MALSFCKPTNALKHNLPLHNFEELRHSPKIPRKADWVAPAHMMVCILPAEVLSTIEDHFRAARGRAAAIFLTLRSIAGPRALRLAPVLLTGHLVPPIRCISPVRVTMVPAMHAVKVCTPFHVRSSKLLHILLVETLLPLVLRHVEPQNVEEAHR